jgi:hypothetical protein
MSHLGVAKLTLASGTVWYHSNCSIIAEGGNTRVVPGSNNGVTEQLVPGIEPSTAYLFKTA